MVYYDSQNYYIEKSKYSNSRFRRYYLNGYIQTNYLISEYGELYSTKTGTMILPETTNKGYFKSTVYHEGKGFKKYNHRMVAETFMIIRESKQTDVNHIDGNKKNNHITNLEWCSRSHNLQHAIDTGLKPRLYGMQSNTSKYTDTQFIMAAKMRADGKTFDEISKVVGIKKPYLKNILNGNATSRRHLIYKYFKMKID